jgi:hypothetical protein
MPYIETSARNDINVTEAFVLLSFLSVLKLQQTPVDYGELAPLVPTFSAAVAKLMHGSGGVERSPSLEQPTPDRFSSPSRSRSASTVPGGPLPAAAVRERSDSKIAGVPVASSPPSAVRERGAKRGSRILSIFGGSKTKDKPSPLSEAPPPPSTVPPFLLRFAVSSKASSFSLSL